MSKKRERTVVVSLPANTVFHLCMESLQAIGVEINEVSPGTMYVRGRKSFGPLGDSHIATIRLRSESPSAIPTTSVTVRFEWPIVKIWGDKYLDESIDDFVGVLERRVASMQDNRNRSGTRRARDTDRSQVSDEWEVCLFDAECIAPTTAQNPHATVPSPDVYAELKWVAHVRTSSGTRYVAESPPFQLYCIPDPSNPGQYLNYVMPEAVGRFIGRLYLEDESGNDLVVPGNTRHVFGLLADIQMHLYERGWENTPRAEMINDHHEHAVAMQFRRKVQTKNEPQWETLVIEAHHGEMMLGRSIVSNVILRGRTLDKCTLMARVYGPVETYTALSYEFSKYDHGDTLEQPSSTNRQTMHEVLDMMDEELRQDGWQRQPNGPHWYNYQYRRQIA